jgi:hypothetical protein
MTNGALGEVRKLLLPEERLKMPAEIARLFATHCKKVCKMFSFALARRWWRCSLPCTFPRNGPPQQARKTTRRNWRKPPQAESIALFIPAILKAFFIAVPLPVCVKTQNFVAEY